MKVYENQVVHLDTDRNSGRTFGDIVFRRCDLESGAFSVADTPELRSTARNLQICDCTVRGSDIWAGIIEDVVVENLRTYTLLQAWGAVFKHVTLRGRIGRIMISSILPPGAHFPPEVELAFQEANEEYYRHVDWALDISKAEFLECDLRGQPVHLIRRDPETQVVVTRAKALRADWRELGLENTFWAKWVDLFLEKEELAVVLAAPKRATNFADLLEGLHRLREAGVAEPD